MPIPFRRRAWLRGARPFVPFALLVNALVACKPDLGECDLPAARELVYSQSGLVATKGQALLHDSCGQGSLCHAAAAQGASRKGVPHDLSFDVLPRPTGIDKVIAERHAIWEQVEDGMMPPRGFVPGKGDWTFDVERRADSPRLAALNTEEGKGALRNWLACGAPTVVDTKVPTWAAPEPMVTNPAVSAWTDLHRKLRKSCVSSGCHDASPLLDGGVAGTQIIPFVADECVVYRWLTFTRDACGARLVVGGDPGASALVHKIEDDLPACGERMPPLRVEMSSDEKAAVERGMAELRGDLRDWVNAGAAAPQCNEWSDRAPRVNPLDAGTAPSEPPTWSKLHADVLAPRCATAACHDAKSKEANLDLSEACAAFKSLQTSGTCGARVVAGNANGSSLYTKVTRPACGGTMPPAPAAPLSGAEAEAIRAWITAGASADGCN